MVEKFWTVIFWDDTPKQITIIGIGTRKTTIIIYTYMFCYMDKIINSVFIFQDESSEQIAIIRITTRKITPIIFVYSYLFNEEDNTCSFLDE